MASTSSLGEICGRKKQRGEENRFIPEELREEILYRLPVNSLQRFKLVCKTWHSRLNSRSMIDSYSRRHSGDFSDKLVCSPYACTYEALMNNSSTTSLMNLVAGPSHLIFPEDLILGVRRPLTQGWRRVFRVLGPLNNGIYSVVVNLHNDSTICLSGGIFAFCNPATNEYRFADIFPCDHASSYLLQNIDSNPSRIHYGFGIVHNDYKFVVVIRWGVGFSSFASFVYSLQSRHWKIIADYEPRKRNFIHKETLLGLTLDNQNIVYPTITDDLELCPQRFFNGCWHWMARGGNVYYVLSFNFADEAFKFIGGPPAYSVYDPNIKGGVFVLSDHLAAIYLSSDVVDVWMMMEYGVEESWTRIYKIMPDFHGEFCKLVGISTRPPRDGETGIIVIERVFFQDNDKQLISCDGSGYKVNGVCDISSLICWNTPGISTYIETLERLKPRLPIYKHQTIR